MSLLWKHREIEDMRQRGEPDPWRVRYTALMDDDTKHVWVETYHWASDDRERAAGNALLSMKYGSHSQIFDGKLYPPHRLREVIWEVL